VQTTSQGFLFAFPASEQPMKCEAPRAAPCFTNSRPHTQFAHSIIHLLHRALALTGTSLILVLSISIASTSHPPCVESSQAMAHRSTPVEEQSEQVRKTRITWRGYSTTISGVLIIVDIVKPVSIRSHILHYFYWLGKTAPRTCKLHRCQLGGAS
jgi:hypothetical protein